MKLSNFLLIFFAFIVNEIFSQGKVIEKTINYEGIKRIVKIWLPQEEQNVKYHTIYVFDADYMFDIVLANVKFLSQRYYDAMPPTIVVGVYYHSNDRREVGLNEADGTLDERGQKFCKYFMKKLIPEVEKKIKTSGFRTLVGHSYTADYILYYFNKHTDFFRGYVGIAPEQLNYEIKLDEGIQKAKLKNYIFLASAEGDVERRIQLASRLASDYKEKEKVNVRHKHFNDSNHQNVVYMSLTNALEHIFIDYWNGNKISTVIDSLYTQIPDLLQFFNQLNKDIYNVGIRYNAQNALYMLSKAEKEKDTILSKNLIEYFIVGTPEANLYEMISIFYASNLNNYIKAEEYAKKSLQLYVNRNTPQDINNVSRFLFKNIYHQHYRNPEKAWNTIKKAQNLTKAAEYDCYFGFIASEYNFKVDEGITHLKKYLNNTDLKDFMFDARPHLANYYLAKCLANKNQMDEAKRYLKKSLELEPGFEPAKLFLNQIIQE